MKILAKAGDETIDLSVMTAGELQQLAQQAKALHDSALAEIDRYGTVRCHLCQKEDITYRDIPFIGWTTSSGYSLCFSCSLKWEHRYGKALSGVPVDNPIDEIMALLD